MPEWCVDGTAYWQPIPKTFTVGVKFFVFPKPETKEGRCQIWIKQRGRLQKQLNPSKMNGNTFGGSCLLLASTGVTQCELLLYAFHVDDLCILYMFIYLFIFNHLLFFAAVCKIHYYKLIFGTIKISFPEAGSFSLSNNVLPWNINTEFNN